MTCEDTTAVRLTWELQQLEPFSKVWICRGYGRATTTAAPADIARAVLAGHLAATPAGAGETFRGLAHAGDGPPHIITTDQLPADDGWTADPDVRQALPIYLREALASA
ncbi:hypothetical protein AB0F30_17115 [Streptomyces sp. NPDC029006]|uniref:hypothetical protein n=1 Tax=Streptomyces sp. NPDC029006 TaxID=3155467 RepID=UPI0033E7EC51